MRFPRIFVNTPTISESPSGFFPVRVNFDSISHIQAWEKTGSNTPSEVVLAGINFNGQRFSESFLTYQSADADVIFRGVNGRLYRVLKNGFDNPFNEPPMNIGSLDENGSGVPHELYLLSSGGKPPAGSPYNRYLPNSTFAAKGSVIIPFATSKGVVIQTGSPNPQFGSEYGFVLGGDLTKEQPTLSPELINKFDEKWGISPISSFVTYN